MKSILYVFVVLCSLVSFSQEAYKYVIVPSKYETLAKNEYNVNALTKSFFETEGFTVYYDTDILPMEIANNRCKILFANAIDDSSFFSTSITITVKDCQNKTLITSKEGKSKEKSYQNAYNEAFRNALTSLKGKLNIKKEMPKEIVNDSTALEGVKANEIINPNQLQAVPTAMGYNLVDYNKFTILVLYKTSLENVFIADKGIQKGVLIKKNDSWYFEYNFEEQLFSEKLEVKF